MDELCSDLVPARSIFLSGRQSTVLAHHRYNEPIRPDLYREGIRSSTSYPFIDMTVDATKSSSYRIPRQPDDGPSSFEWA